MATVTPPELLPSPRVDLLVTAADGRPLRSTTYSGTMRFGRSQQVLGLQVTGGTQAYVQFAGPAFLPDGLRYGGPGLGEAVVVGHAWLASALGDRTRVEQAVAGWLPDPRDPGQHWLGLTLDVFGTGGLLVGYRVEVLVAPDAVLGDPTRPDGG